MTFAPARRAPVLFLIGVAALWDAQAQSPTASPPAVPPTATPPSEAAPAATSPAAVPPESTLPDSDSWLDKSREVIYDAVWRSAMHVDRWFGSTEPDVAYEQASGSIAPAVLWSRYYGLQTHLRFHADVPLPAINDNVHAFVGRVNPEEFISESQPESGQFPNPFAPNPEDQTLFGIQYSKPATQGPALDFGVGLPIQLKFDPYVKGGYTFAHGTSPTGLLFWRQDLFYQDSQGGFGVTSRLDLQRLFGQNLLIGWTGSTTVAQRTYGFRSYSTLDAILAFPNQRAIDMELSVDGTLDPTHRILVPLHDYGVKVAFRRTIFREWLVLEVRTSVDWPKDYPYQDRTASFGLGVGVEMYFGNYRFQARPVTF